MVELRDHSIYYQKNPGHLDRIAQKTGFRVTSHRLEFRGLCQDCQSGNSIKGG